jgi:hypothetical protein
MGLACRERPVPVCVTWPQARWRPGIGLGAAWLWPSEWPVDIQTKRGGRHHMAMLRVPNTSPASGSNLARLGGRWRQIDP